MFKRCRNTKSKNEKIRGRNYSRKRAEEIRRYNRNQINAENENTVFAVWRSKDTRPKEVRESSIPEPSQRPNVQQNVPSNHIVKTNVVTSTPTDANGPILEINGVPSLSGKQIRRSDRLVTKRIPNIIPTNNVRPKATVVPNYKSIFSAICEDYTNLFSTKTNSDSSTSRQNQFHSGSINDDFNIDLFRQGRLGSLPNIKSSITMNIEEKIRHINNILKGKSTPVINRPSLKRKQTDAQENDFSLKLFTPSKYVFSTPENQKLKPVIIDKSPNIVTAVYQADQKEKILYRIDKKAIENIDAIEPNKPVPIDSRFLKPLCQNEAHENQFLKVPHEYTINLDPEIVTIENYQQNVAEVPHNISYEGAEDHNCSLFTLPNIPNPSSENNVMDFTFAELPSTSKFVPKATSEHKMSVTCTQRPAKMPRTGFHRSLSRKSLNFENSPNSTPKKSSFNFKPTQNPNFHRMDFEWEKMFHDEHHDDMEMLEANMNFTLNDKENFPDVMKF